MAHKVWVAGEEVTAADFQTYLQNQVAATFATKAALDAGWTGPPNGALAITTDTNTLWLRVAGAWRPFPDRGVFTGTVDAAGRTPAISHKVGAIPSVVIVTPLAGNGSQFFVESRTATTFNVRLFQSTGADATGSVTVAWLAYA